ncbi:MAG: ATPase domain-containing protein [Candidatus Hodarchaeales archaeon]
MLFTFQDEEEDTDERVPTGIPVLDEMLNGGLYPGGVCIVNGEFGVGKSTVGIQFLIEGAKCGEKGILILTEELPRMLVKRFGGMDLEKYIRDGTIIILDILSSRLFQQKQAVTEGLRSLSSISKLEKILMDILVKVEELQAKRLVMDSLQSYLTLSGDTSIERNFLILMTELCRREKITTLLISEKSEHVRSDLQEFVADGVINLTRMIKHNRSYRVIQITKMRQFAHDAGIHPYVITDQGLKIIPAYKMTTAIDEITGEKIPFGIKKLDDILGRGIFPGSSWLFEVDYLSDHWQHFCFSFLNQAIKHGFSVIFDLPSDFNVQKAQLYSQRAGLTVKEYLSTFLVFIDYHQAPEDDNPEVSPGVWYFRPHLQTTNSFIEIGKLMRAKIQEKLQLSGKNFKNFVTLSSFSDFATFFGEEAFLSEIIPFFKQKKTTNEIFISIINPKLHTSSFVEKIRALMDGIISFEVEDGIRYVKVDKSPDGYISPKYLVDVSEARDVSIYI